MHYCYETDDAAVKFYTFIFYDISYIYFSFSAFRYSKESRRWKGLTVSTILFFSTFFWGEASTLVILVMKWKIISAEFFMNI